MSLIMFSSSGLKLSIIICYEKNYEKKSIMLLKNYQLNIIKKIKEDYEKKLVKDIKIFLRKKKKKKQQYSRERYKNVVADKKINWLI